MMRHYTQNMTSIYFCWDVKPHLSQSRLGIDCTVSCGCCVKLLKLQLLMDLRGRLGMTMGFDLLMLQVRV